MDNYTNVKNRIYPWNILGIDPTMDKKKIKRAYAHKSKDAHPEENPLEFQTLYDSYKQALNIASVGEEMNSTTAIDEEIKELTQKDDSFDIVPIFEEVEILEREEFDGDKILLKKISSNVYSKDETLLLNYFMEFVLTGKRKYLRKAFRSENFTKLIQDDRVVNLLHDVVKDHELEFTNHFDYLYRKLKKVKTDNETEMLKIFKCYLKSMIQVPCYRMSLYQLRSIPIYVFFIFALLLINDETGEYAFVLFMIFCIQTLLYRCALVFKKTRRNINMSMFKKIVLHAQKRIYYTIPIMLSLYLFVFVIFDYQVYPGPSAWFSLSIGYFYFDIIVRALIRILVYQKG